MPWCVDQSVAVRRLVRYARNTRATVRARRVSSGRACGCRVHSCLSIASAAATADRVTSCGACLCLKASRRTPKASVADTVASRGHRHALVPPGGHGRHTHTHAITRGGGCAGGSRPGYTNCWRTAHAVCGGRGRHSLVFNRRRCTHSEGRTHSVVSGGGWGAGVEATCRWAGSDLLARAHAGLVLELGDAVALHTNAKAVQLGTRSSCGLNGNTALEARTRVWIACC
jgi:hypothetical protein